MERLTFIFSIILMFIPFVSGYARWEEWIIFSIGIILAIIASYRMLYKKKGNTPRQ